MAIGIDGMLPTPWRSRWFFCCLRPLHQVQGKQQSQSNRLEQAKA
ncbi:MAG: hypothetical protein WBG32_06445 [Nodosilinea sp.]